MTYRFTEPPPLLKMALEHGARTHVISKLWHIPAHKSKEIYRHVRHESPPSGRKPDSLEWYFTPHAQVASSFLMALYDHIYALTKDRVQSFVTAYDAYVRYSNEQPVVNINRWFFLWQTIMNARKYHDDPSQQEISIAKCRSCGSEMLVPAYQIKSTFKCPDCAGSLIKSDKHTVYRHERELAHSVNSVNH